MQYDSTTDGFIDNASLFPYPVHLPSTDGSAAHSAVPIAINLTEFHFVLLYKDRIVCVSTLNEKVTYEEMLPLVCSESYIPSGLPD